MRSAKSVRKAERRKHIAEKGINTAPHFTTAKHKEWVLRVLHECGFDLNKAKQNLQGRIDYHKNEIPKALKEGNSFWLNQCREHVAFDTNALNYLKFLEKKGPDGWLSKARKLRDRDLIVGHKNIMPVEEQVKALFQLTTISSHENLADDLKLISMSGGHNAPATNAGLQNMLTNTIALQTGFARQMYEKVEQETGKVSERAIVALRKSLSHDQAVLDYLKAIDTMSEKEKHKKLRELMES